MPGAIAPATASKTHNYPQQVGINGDVIGCRHSQCRTFASSFAGYYWSIRSARASRAFEYSRLLDMYELLSPNSPQVLRTPVRTSRYNGPHAYVYDTIHACRQSLP